MQAELDLDLVLLLTSGMILGGFLIFLGLHVIFCIMG